MPLYTASRWRGYAAGRARSCVGVLLLMLVVLVLVLVLALALALVLGCARRKKRS